MNLVNYPKTFIHKDSNIAELEKTFNNWLIEYWNKGFMTFEEFYFYKYDKMFNK